MKKIRFNEVKVEWFKKESFPKDDLWQMGLKAPF